MTSPDRQSSAWFSSRRGKFFLLTLLVFYVPVFLLAGISYLEARYNGTPFNWVAELKFAFIFLTVLMLVANVPWKRLMRTFREREN